jgi:hypothetical protein
MPIASAAIRRRLNVWFASGAKSHWKGGSRRQDISGPKLPLSIRARGGRNIITAGPVAGASPERTKKMDESKLVRYMFYSMAAHGRLGGRHDCLAKMPLLRPTMVASEWCRSISNFLQSMSKRATGACCAIFLAPSNFV